MIKQVTVTDLQRRAAEVISGLTEGPVIVSQRGRPAAVIVTAEAYEQMEQALAEVEARRVREIVEAGLSSYRASRTSPQQAVARRVRAARRKK
jgi:prevent-host-death family protein